MLKLATITLALALTCRLSRSHAKPSGSSLIAKDARADIEGMR